MKRKNNQSEVFERLVGPHLNTLYKTAWRLTGRQEEAEDLIQDLLVKLYPKTWEIADLERPAPWLKKVLYREFVDQLRKKKRRPENYLLDVDGEMGSLPEKGDSPEKLTERAMDAERLQAALDLFGRRQRSILVMHLVEGYTLAEIAGIFEMTPAAVKTMLRRAKQALKKILQA